jgi:cysteine desulfurase
MPYFDHNATAPLAPAAREAWLKVADELWHNPSSPYRAAARARLRLDSARATVATVLGCPPERIVFTSGATEAAHAIMRHLAATLPADARVAVNPTEHPCVLAAAGEWFPGRSAALPVSAQGVVEPADASLDGVAAVVVMAANNETGVLQPWRAWREACAARQVPLVCDASQWLGKLPADGFGAVDWVFGAAHKFGGPKGVGFVKLPAQAEGFRIFGGGAQENGHRAGTEDVAGIAALAVALAEAEQRKVFLETDRLHVRERFEREVTARVSGIRIVGAGAERLWNTVSVILPHGENTRWVAALDKRGFQVSTGSACATGKEGPSHVLAALGVAPEEARRVVRVSSGWETPAGDWSALADAFAAVDVELRASAPANVIRPA